MTKISSVIYVVDVFMTNEELKHNISPQFLRTVTRRIATAKFQNEKHRKVFYLILAESFAIKMANVPR